MQRFQGCTSFCEASVKTAPPPPKKKQCYKSEEIGTSAQKT